MAYTPDYTSSDLSASAINTIAVGILTVGTFASILTLGVVFWMAKKVVKAK